MNEVFDGASRETSETALRSQAKRLRETAARLEALADVLGNGDTGLKVGSPEEYVLWEMIVSTWHRS